MGAAANRAIKKAPTQLIATIRCQASGSASKNLMRASLCPAAEDMLMPAQLIRMRAPDQTTAQRRAGRLRLRDVGDELEEPRRTPLGGELMRPGATSTRQPGARAASTRHHPAHAASRDHRSAAASED
jgi:hypothetical protein